MKHRSVLLLLGVLVWLTQSKLQAQPQRPGVGPGQQPPLLRVFDLDGDDELSPKEIEQAAESLRKLDKNRDGRLAAEALRAQGPGGRGRRGGRSGRGGPPGRGGQQPPGRGGPPSREGRQPQGDDAFAEQLLELDQNKDKKLSRAELPEHMHKAFDLVDADEDGLLDADERLKLAEQFRRNRLRPSQEAPRQNE